MANVKVERRGNYQGVPQYGITGFAEITPSRKTAEKWAQLENNRLRSNIFARLAKDANRFADGTDGDGE